VGKPKDSTYADLEMFFRVIRKIAQRQLLRHLFIPLVVGFIIERSLPSVAGYCGGLLNNQIAKLTAPILGVIGAYPVIMYLVLANETDKGMKRLGPSALEEALEHSTSYFAVAAINLREWFEPATQVYLATILKRKLSPDQNFRYDRILLFFTDDDEKDLGSQYLSGYYARSLIEIHKLLGIQMAYLQPDEISAILKELTIKEKKAIGYHTRWLPEWVPNRAVNLFPLRWLWVRNKRLAFSIVEYPDRTTCVLPFSKRHFRVRITKIEGANEIAPYEKLVGLIRKKVYKEDPPWPNAVVRSEHDFTNYY